MAKADKSEAIKKAAAAKTAAAERLSHLEDKITAAYKFDPAVEIAQFLAKPYVRNGLKSTVQATDAKGLSAADKKWMWAGRLNTSSAVRST